MPMANSSAFIVVLFLRILHFTERSSKPILYPAYPQKQVFSNDSESYIFSRCRSLRLMNKYPSLCKIANLNDMTSTVIVLFT
jgi:hypothetical protein